MKPFIPLLSALAYMRICHGVMPVDTDAKDEECVRWVKSFAECRLRFHEEFIRAACHKLRLWLEGGIANASKADYKQILTTNQLQYFFDVTSCRKVDCICDHWDMCQEAKAKLKSSYAFNFTELYNQMKSGAVIEDVHGSLLIRSARSKRQLDFTAETETVRKFGKVTRKEVRAMDEEERNRFFAALNTLKTDKVDNMTKYDIMIILHTSDRAPEAHNGAAFLPFHREFLKNMEVALRLIDPQVSLPYWDSSLDHPLPVPADSVLWSEELYGNGDGDVVTGPFANWTVLADPIVADLTPSRKIFRAVGQDQRAREAMIGEGDIKKILAKPEYRNLVYCVDPFTELVHGANHLFIGGHMVDLRTSPNDPSFFLVHGFVDLIWELWRQSRSAKVRSTYVADNETCNPYAKADMLIKPFTAKLTDGLSNMYLDEFYAYQPRPTCTSKSPTCYGSPYLYCDAPNSRCISKVRLNGNCTGYDGKDICYKSKCDKGICVPITETTPAQMRNPTTPAATSTSTAVQPSTSQVSTTPQIKPSVPPKTPQANPPIPVTTTPPTSATVTSIAPSSIVATSTPTSKPSTAQPTAIPSTTKISAAAATTPAATAPPTSTMTTIASTTPPTESTATTSSSAATNTPVVSVTTPPPTTGTTQASTTPPTVPNTPSPTVPAVSTPLATIVPGTTVNGGSSVPDPTGAATSRTQSEAASPTSVATTSVSTSATTKPSPVSPSTPVSSTEAPSVTLSSRGSSPTASSSGLSSPVGSQTASSTTFVASSTPQTTGLPETKGTTDGTTTAELNGIKYTADGGTRGASSPATSTLPNVKVSTATPTLTPGATEISPVTPPNQTTNISNTPTVVWFPITVLSQDGNASAPYPNASIICHASDGKAYPGKQADPNVKPYYTGAAYGAMPCPFSGPNPSKAEIVVQDEFGKPCRSLCLDKNNKYLPCNPTVTLDIDRSKSDRIPRTPNLSAAKFLSWNGNEREPDKFLFICNAPKSANTSGSTSPPNTGSTGKYIIEVDNGNQTEIATTHDGTHQVFNGGCLNLHRCCDLWANGGECPRNLWMQLACEASCNVCDSGIDAKPPGNSCIDYHPRCPDWGAMGQCTDYAPWMEENCRKTCNICSRSPQDLAVLCGSPKKAGCQDYNVQCGGWAKRSECDSNQWWMKQNCPLSCKLCSPDQAVTAPAKYV